MSKDLNREIVRLAVKHYKTADLTRLGPQQLDRLTNLATNIYPNTQARTRGRTYSGNTYNKLKKIF